MHLRVGGATEVEVQLFAEADSEHARRLRHLVAYMRQQAPATQVLIWTSKIVCRLRHLVASPAEQAPATSILILGVLCRLRHLMVYMRQQAPATQILILDR